MVQDLKIEIEEIKYNLREFRKWKILVSEQEVQIKSPTEYKKWKNLGC